MNRVLNAVREHVSVGPDAEAAVLEHVQAAYDEGRQRWPGVEVPVSAFASAMASRLGDDVPLMDALARIRGADLFLTVGCCMGDAAALAAFDNGYLADVPAMIGRLRLTAAEADEVAQLVRERLLVGTERGGPRLAQYAGRGDLRNWVRVAAVRVAQNRSAVARPEIPVDDAALDRAVGGGQDLQLEHLKNQYGTEFRRAFETAVETLDAKERNLLRFHYLEGMTGDGLAAMYGVHRATAARWVAAARSTLAERVRKQMMQDLGIDHGDWRSIMRMIQSQLDVSVRRHLGRES